MGIEIALNWNMRLNVACKGSIDGPVEADCVDRYLVDITPKRCARPTWKPDDFRSWNLLADLGDDLCGRSNTPPIELLRTEHPAPGIEDLNGISTSSKLPDKVVDRCLS